MMMLCGQTDPVLLLTRARAEARHNSYRAAINSCVTECDGCGSSAPQSPFLPRCKFLVTNNPITREGNALGGRHASDVYYRVSRLLTVSE